MLLLLSLTAHADLAPPNTRALQYTFTIDNLDEYPDHVLLLYPTSNNGFAYVVEPDKGLTGVMMREGWRGESTSLYAVPRADFEANNPEPAVHDHGDGGAMVMVVRPPGSAALRAELDIRPPELVPSHDPQIGLERIVHIATLSESTFALELVSERAIYREDASAPAVVEPSQTRCGAIAGSGGLLALAAVLLGITRRRYPTSSSSQ